jgi:hypothetical protein
LINGVRIWGERIEKRRTTGLWQRKKLDIETLRATLRSLSSNDLVITFQICLEIVALVRKISVEEVRKDDFELMRDLAAEYDSFLTRKVQILKDTGVLDFLLLVPGSAEQIRRNMRVENLIMSYVTQARLFARVKMPMEAVARAQEGLVLCEKMGSFCSVKGSLKECFICEKLSFCNLKDIFKEIIKTKGAYQISEKQNVTLDDYCEALVCGRFILTFAFSMFVV